MKLNQIFQAKQRGLSAGVRREAGRGQRVMVMGIGGEEGWIHLKVIKRCMMDLGIRILRRAGRSAEIRKANFLMIW